MTMKNKLILWMTALLCASNTVMALEPSNNLAGSVEMGSPAVSTATPDANGLAATLAHLYPNTHFTSVKPSPVGQLFEVTMGRTLAYVDMTGRHFFFGHLYDMQANRDLTADLIADLNRIDASSLPLHDAIVTVKGDGSRVVNILSDPGCHFCQQFEKTLDGMTNIRIQTWLVPLQPGSDALAQKIWCAADKSKAWRDWMLTHTEPSQPVARCDASALQRNVELTQRLQTAGTPTIISAGGRVHSGAMDSVEFAAWLAAEHPSDSGIDGELS
jgi:thiol:disulfide interchange protein DsbC